MPGDVLPKALLMYRLWVLQRCDKCPQPTRVLQTLFRIIHHDISFVNITKKTTHFCVVSMNTPREVNHLGIVFYTAGKRQCFYVFILHQTTHKINPTCDSLLWVHLQLRNFSRQSCGKPIVSKTSCSVRTHNLLLSFRNSLFRRLTSILKRFCGSNSLKIIIRFKNFVSHSISPLNKKRPRARRTPEYVP
jgi:hypothetical protein